MLRRVLRWLAGERGDRPTQDDEESGGRRFVPSRLDFSVRSSHGGGNTEGDRELERLDTEAQTLERERKET